MVATHGNLLDAAGALGRTPSAVSMMLKQFEDHIGSALFETARKSWLTPIGELTLAEARREVTHFENGLCTQITDLDFAPILARSRMMVHNNVSLLGLVRQGVGITVLPRLAVADHLHEFAFLPLVDMAARRTAHLMSRSNTLLMPAAREFLRQIVEMKRDGSLMPDAKFRNSD